MADVRRFLTYENLVGRRNVDLIRFFVWQVTIEKGKTLSIKCLALADDLTPSGEREVFFEMNGQMRSVFIKDNEARKVRRNPSSF